MKTKNALGLFIISFYFSHPILLAQNTPPPATLNLGDKNLINSIPAFLKAPRNRWATLDNKEAVELLDPNNPQVGLRVLAVGQNNLQELRRLAQNNFIQSGDIALTFRPEWVGGGPYANVQMAISHAGLAFHALDDKGLAVIKNVENPLNSEYLANPNRLGDPDHFHYKTVKMVHIVRSKKIPNDSPEQSNVRRWAALFNKYATDIYGNGLLFNRDYNSPAYAKEGLKFVHRLAQMALRIAPKKDVATYCSEFAWAVSSLYKCDPEKNAAQFATNAPEPAPCIKEIFMPKPGLGDAGVSGLAEGPLSNILAIGKDKAAALTQEVFAAGDASSKMSPGHVALATAFNRDFAPVLKAFYDAVLDGNEALQTGIRSKVNSSSPGDGKTPANYSPTSFLIEAISPLEKGASYEYVMTLYFK